MSRPAKTIPPARDRLQSRLLVWIMAPALCIAAFAPAINAVRTGLPIRPFFGPLSLSLGFAILVWLLRSATRSAAAVGLLVCFILAQNPAAPTGFSPPPIFRSAIPALVALFALTFAATRFGRSRKEARGLSEPRTGRRAAQVVANLSIAAVCAALGSYYGCIAALAEATADTLSSEIGQAIGGPALLITNLRRVPPGTDGAVSLSGTVAGILGAAAVVAAASTRHLPWPAKALIFCAAIAGLFFDSLLGATLERRGYLNNDLVNFASTAFASSLALLALNLL